MEGLLVLLALVFVAAPIAALVALVKIGALRRRVDELERDLGQLLEEGPDAVRAAAEQRRRDAQHLYPGAVDPWSRPTHADAPKEPVATEKPPGDAWGRTLGERPVVADAVQPAPEPAPARAATSATMGTAATPAPSWPTSPAPEPVAASTATATADGRNEVEITDPIVRAVRRWFSEGNVPVKVGMLVLFAGVAALLKYVADQGWMRFPIELRLAGIAAFALAGLVFGWHQRERKRAFALSLQGGAIGVLLLTVFAAFRYYDLLPAGAALALSVVLVGASGVLAVAQHAQALAVLGILAGFLAPVLLSTGSGNHVMLFSYYAVLNAAIFAIAWFRSWRALNLLGFVFTYAIGSYWGVLDYQPDKLASTLPFLVLFFAFYLLLPILYARDRDEQTIHDAEDDQGAEGRVRHGLVDGALVFGNPLFSFLLLAGLLDGARLPLAYSAVAIAALYAVLAWLLIGRQRFRPLAQAHAVLAVGFATLAVPLALSARVTASVFALEGAALLWLGLRQDQRLSLWAGVALQGLAALVFLLYGSYWHSEDLALANPGFLGALMLALAGFASAWSCWNAGQARPALGFYLWGLFWWLHAALAEIERFVAFDQRAAVALGFVAANLALLAVARRWWPVSALAWTVAAGLAAAIPLCLKLVDLHGQPFAHPGWLAWVGYALAGIWALRSLREQDGLAPAWAHSAWLLAVALATGLGLEWVASSIGLGSGWLDAALVAPWLLLFAFLLLRPAWAGWPLATRLHEWHAPLLLAGQLVVAFIGVQLLLRAGDASPLPWLPVLNPAELALIASLALTALWLRSTHAPPAIDELRVRLLAAAAFAVVSSITLRAVHQIGGVDWQASALFDSALAQASLSLVWSVLGVAGWILGSRRGQRGLWLAGAVLMAVVLAKLILIDRQHLGDLFGIVSFIGYGLLCTAVGYFAPAPPREPDPDHSEAMAMEERT